MNGVRGGGCVPSHNPNTLTSLACEGRGGMREEDRRESEREGCSTDLC